MLESRRAFPLRSTGDCQSLLWTVGWTMGWMQCTSRQHIKKKTSGKRLHVANWKITMLLIWVNYNDLTMTSLISWLVRGIIPKWPYFRIVKYYNLPRWMGKSTSSTGPFSIAKCKKLPEGIQESVGVFLDFSIRFLTSICSIPLCFSSGNVWPNGWLRASLDNDAPFATRSWKSALDRKHRAATLPFIHIHEQRP